jgi:LytTr DNA-binding domain
MNTSNVLDPVLSLRQLPLWLRSAGYGYLYWLVFLLALEPGNVLRAYNMGHTLQLDIEVARICVAALLGASVSPLLIRETLANFERRLDPGKFVRVHRRTIVAVGRIREIRPLANGDSELILHDGRELRASRSYREALRKRWT